MGYFQEHQRMENDVKNCHDFLDGYGNLIDAKRRRAKDCVDISRIVGRLYLGSYEEGASAYEGLKLLGITHILTVGVKMPVVFPGHFVYKVVELWDDPSEDIEKYFDECHEFIGNALRDCPKNNVFVHCFAGISRSATIVMSYLIKTYTYGYADAYETVRKGRFFVNPNKGFKGRLRRLARQVTGEEEKGQKEYDEAVSILQADYAGRSIPEDKRCEVVRIFGQLFGPFHPHVLDLYAELEMLRSIIR